MLHWDSSDLGSPVSVSMDLRMPQFTIEEVVPTKCFERFHLGEHLLNEFYLDTQKLSYFSVLLWHKQML